MGTTSIEWTERTWNPIRGCSRVSEGCRNCYAERVAARFSGEGLAFAGLAERAPSGPRWTGEVRLVEEHLEDPLRWRRPRRVFVNSVSDLFHERVPDEWLDRIFATMALVPRHTFQVLTKRPERMCDYFGENGWAVGGAGIRGPMRDRLEIWARRIRPGWSDEDDHVHGPFPMPNVELGVSVENQRTLDERLPALAATPAALRFLSAEPLLEPVDLCLGDYPAGIRPDLVIVGGESGPGARPCRLDWLRSIVRQCREAEVLCFVKQAGAHVLDADGRRVRLEHPKGGDLGELPEDLRVRELPRRGAPWSR